MSDENSTVDQDGPVSPEQENTEDDGTYVGTEESPLTETVNADPDPNGLEPTGSSHRHAEKQGQTEYTATTEDGKTITWTDPDAIPGTVGDSVEQTLRAAAAGSNPQSVKVEES